MDIFIILLFTAILFVLISTKISLNNKIQELEQQILSLKELLRKNISDKKDTPVQNSPVTHDVKEPGWSAEIIKSPLAKDKESEHLKSSITDQPIKKPQPIVDKTGKRIVIDSPTLKPSQPPEQRPSFFERYPDLEKFIGENLINKIGIAILVLAIGYFIKYAIDANWIGPIGRVAIGFICGGILVSLAHRMRNSYKAFSSVLVGGGISVFYFSTTLAYHQFTPPVFNQTSAFIIMVVITAFTVALSLLYNRQELAIIALVGGLASPFMVSNGTANYQALFIYVLIINIGLLVVAYNKAWRLLNFLVFVLSQLIYVSVLFTINTKGAGTALVFGCFFYLLYFTINVANNIKEGKKFIASDFGILLSNAAIYFSAGLYLLTYLGLPQYRGLFSAIMGILNLAASYLLLRNKKADTNILYLLIGITITFISLTAPIQLHGNNITLFWASEAVLLYWLYQKSGIVLMRYTALGIWTIMLISLLADLFDFYYGFAMRDIVITKPIVTIIANKGFITAIYAAICTYALSILVGRDEGSKAKVLPKIHVTNKLLIVSAIVLLFFAGLLEVDYQYSSRYPQVNLNILYDLFYTTVFVLVFDTVATKLAETTFKKAIRFVIIAVTIAIYLSDIGSAFNYQAFILTQKTLSLHFIIHWLNATIIVVLFVRMISLYRGHFGNFNNLFSWITSINAILFLSFEVSLIANAIFFVPPNNLSGVSETYIQTGLPLLWGLCSFVLMWLGMHYKYKPLRIISLTIFSVTLLKLFLFDLRNIPVAGKIIAFFCLGVLLLIISFMYQKVKKIIISDEDSSME